MHYRRQIAAPAVTGAIQMRRFAVLTSEAGTDAEEEGAATTDQWCILKYYIKGCVNMAVAVKTGLD